MPFHGSDEQKKAADRSSLIRGLIGAVVGGSVGYLVMGEQGAAFGAMILGFLAAMSAYRRSSR